MKRKTAPKTEGIAQAAKALGVSRAEVERAKAAGCLAFLPGNRADVGKLRRWFKRHPKPATGGKLDIVEASLRLMDEKARLARFDRLEAERRLVDVFEVVAMFEQVMAPVRQRLLSLPNELCQQANPTNPHVAREALERWVDESLGMIRRGLPLPAPAEGVA